ncbi:MAG: ATP-binding protein [Desertifilum sp.]|nr:ATP-binding protein [Desertifilum sp.]MDI9640860.1 ATP-binding protein [Geitlerinema splendidum]
MGLKRTLSPSETWGFGFAGHLAFLSTAPIIAAELGWRSLWVWLPCVPIAMLLMFQVKRLAQRWPDVSGGTPSYILRIFRRYPLLGQYAAIGYYLSWVAFVPVNAIVLTDLIQANLATVDLQAPAFILNLLFTLLMWAIAFSGTRALAIVTLFFMVPAMGLLLLFSVQGLGWLIFSPNSPGLFPSPSEVQNLPPWQFSDWAKSFFVAIYGIYGCEIGAAFMADSRSPQRTANFLNLSAFLIAPIAIGGTWVLARLSTTSLGDNAYLAFLSASSNFWGPFAPPLVTFSIASACLLASATAVAATPRMAYQFAQDGYLAPVLGIISRRGVMGPALLLNLTLSLLCLAWGNISQIVMVTGSAWVAAGALLHLGLWLRRRRSFSRWPYISLACFGIESVVLIVGGLAWDGQDLIVGLLLPGVAIWVDWIVRQVRFAPFQAQWWIDRYNVRDRAQVQDFVRFQVLTLIGLVGGSSLITWWIDRYLGNSNTTREANNLFVVWLLTAVFLGIAIACWTSLPQATAIIEARQQAEHFFKIALDAIIILDERGYISQANPAAERLFHRPQNRLIGRSLTEFLTDFPTDPNTWIDRSEHHLILDEEIRILDVAKSDRSTQVLTEYVIILRDITERKHQEVSLRLALESQEQLAATATAQARQLEDTLEDLKRTQSQLIHTEKMSSLGQLVAGVAHEINNPVNFIFGNLSHARDYTRDLLDLIDLYQTYFPNPPAAITEKVEATDLEFIIADFPQLIASMHVGANRIREIVQSLRHFARIDEAQIKAVNIHEGIDSTLMILQNRTKAKPDRPAIGIVKEYGDLPLVECYPGLLNQVFMNLLCNAIDALEEYHSVSKSRSGAWLGRTSPTSRESLTQTRRSEIQIRTEYLPNTRTIRITLRDNGPGIAPDVLERIFEPFFTTKPIGLGTGLGLAISHQAIVEKHHGKLECVSQPGEGTTFYLEIPLRQDHTP